MRGKKIAAILLTLALLTAFAGCGDKDGGAKDPPASGNSTPASQSAEAGGDAEKPLDPIKVAEDMKAAFTLQGELLAVEDSVLDNYYQAEPQVVGGHKVYVSTSWVAEEIAVFAVEEGKGEDAKKMLETRLEDLRASFDGYLPQELASLEANAKILTNKNLICLLTGTPESVAAAEKVFTDAK